jgi:hypothetical protein
MTLTDTDCIGGAACNLDENDDTLTASQQPQVRVEPRLETSLYRSTNELRLSRSMGGTPLASSSSESGSPSTPERRPQHHASVAPASATVSEQPDSSEVAIDEPSKQDEALIANSPLASLLPGTSIRGWVRKKRKPNGVCVARTLHIDGSRSRGWCKPN